MKLLFATILLVCLYSLIKIIYLLFQVKTEFEYGSIVGNLILFLVSVVSIFYLRNKLKK